MAPNPPSGGDGAGSPSGPPLTVAEAAWELNCSSSTVRRLIDSRRLPAVRVGRGLRIPAWAVERMLTP